MTQSSRILQALLVAALASALFLGAALLPGRALVPFPPENIPPLGSELTERGLTRADLLIGNPTGGDKYNQSLAWDRLSHDRFARGEWPLWTRALGGGAPVVPQMGQIYMPWTWLLAWLHPTTLYGPWFFLHQCVLGLLVYLFLSRLGLSHGAALVGVVCAVAGLWTQARVHHNVILSAALPLFGALTCVHALFAGAGWRVAGALALAVGIPWLGGFAPVALQSAYVVLAFAVACTLSAPPGQRRMAWLRVGCAFALGGLIACPQMLPVLAANQDSARSLPSLPDMRQQTMDWAHLLTAVWPDLLCWSAPTFFADSLDNARPPYAALWLLDQQGANRMNWPETAFAIGVPGVALLLAALTDRQRRAPAWFFAACAGLGLLLAMGRWPFLEVATLLPGTRSGDARRFLFLTAIGLPVLAALGADRWLRGESLRLSRWFALGLALLSAALFALHLAPAPTVERAYAELAVQRYAAQGVTSDLFLAKVHPTEGAANRAHLLATFGRAALAAAATWLALRWRRRSVLALVAVTALELWHAGRGPVVAVPATRVDTPPRLLAPALAATTAADRAGQPRPRMQRIEPLAPGDQGPRPTQLLQGNLPAFWGLEDLGIYTSLAPRRLEQLFDAIDPAAPGEPRVVLGGAGVQTLRRPAALAHPLLDVLGLRYVAASRALQEANLRDCTPADYPGAERLYERTTAGAPFGFVARARIVPDTTERLRLLGDRTRDARSEVLLENPEAPAADADATATVRVVTWADEHLAFAVDAHGAGYLRVADPWDAGWTATLDGTPTELFVADHCLRAVHVPTGAHIVELRYDGAQVRWPPRLGLLGATIALLLCICGRRRSPR